MIHAEPEIKTLFSLSQDCALINQLCVVVVVTLSLSLSLSVPPRRRFRVKNVFPVRCCDKLNSWESQSKFSFSLCIKDALVLRSSKTGREYIREHRARHVLRAHKRCESFKLIDNDTNRSTL